MGLRGNCNPLFKSQDLRPQLFDFVSGGRYESCGLAPTSVPKIWRGLAQLSRKISGLFHRQIFRSKCSYESDVAASTNATRKYWFPRENAFATASSWRLPAKMNCGEFVFGSPKFVKSELYPPSSAERITSNLI